MLTWVHTPIEDGKKRYYILPAAKYENQPDFFKSVDDYNKMTSFIKDSRTLFNAENKNVPEYIYEDDKWKLNE
jgi:poly-gamma-glutamate synthesis protein (capsule biosynthesis protein)